MSDQNSIETSLSNSMLHYSMVFGGICVATALGAAVVHNSESLSVSSLFAGLLLGVSVMSAVVSFVMLRVASYSKKIQEHKLKTEISNDIIEAKSGYLDDLPVGFFVIGKDGAFRYVNKTLAGWFGLNEENLLSKNARFVEFMVDPDAPSSGGAGHIALKDTNDNAFNAYIIHENKSDITNDDAVRAIVMRDLDVLKENTETAGNSENGNKFDPPPAWLFENAPVGIALLSENGLIRQANRELGRYLGKQADALTDSDLAEYVAAENREDISAALSKLMMGTARAVRIDVRIPLDGAEEHAASLYISVREGDDTFDDGLILHVIDETEHRHLEVQFTQSQKMQAVGQLAGGVAHDFNNLLTAMIGFSDLLLERHGPDDPSFDDIMQIRQNANRATNLVRQLLAFSRKQTLEPVVIDPGEALADLANLLRRLIDEQVDLQFDHAPDAYLIQADRGQFDQVIINLAVNARDAMPGGGTLSIKTRNETVTAPVQRGSEIMAPGAYLVIEVMDTGTGIARENLDRIFEPFYSTKEVGAGTGLGLSTVYGIVRQSEGFIFVESAMGLGTTFSIYLTAYGTDGEVDAEASVVAANKALSDRRAALNATESEVVVDADLTGDSVILLVEDEDAVRKFGARALRNKGYTVIEADNGESGLDAINEAAHSIDLIVSDVVMPGMDGHTFVQLVRQEIPEMKVILMSGYAEDVFREEISRDTTIHFLAKPFSLKTLASTVKSVLVE
ncbi:MAG: response regulator [Rhodospirillales bacterium]|nr:response regulator [Rhodospirillales bacterium]